MTSAPQPGKEVWIRLRALQKDHPSWPGERLRDRTLHPNDPVNQNAWMKVHQKRLLDKGKAAEIVS